MTAGLIPPHGGTLVNLLVSPDEAAELRGRAPSLPSVRLGPRSLSDLELLSIGAFSPLDGFLLSDDYESVVAEMRLASGLPWSIPVTLPVDGDTGERARPGQQIVLRDSAGRLLALMDVTERYDYDREREAELVYRTTDPAHPGVAALYQQGPVLLGGPLRVVDVPRLGDFGSYRLDPAATRREIANRGWRSVVGFQTRNPVHRAHEYIQKCALELVDGLLLHPVVGETKDDDIPADVRLRCYEALLREYYPGDCVLLAVLPAAMRYAGPREAIFHALVRKNYGCSHFIVGRDHAGVGNYYGTYDAQRIFDGFAPGELGITPLFFEHTYYCRRCEAMSSPKTCPHNSRWHVQLSGTELRAMLREGRTPPPEFTRPEVAAILIEALGAENVRAR